MQTIVYNSIFVREETSYFIVTLDNFWIRFPLMLFTELWVLIDKFKWKTTNMCQIKESNIMIYKIVDLIEPCFFAHFSKLCDSSTLIQI